MADGFTNFPASIDLNIKKVQPQTEIYLASGIEWDNNYIHVRAFSSVTDLLNHVISKVPDDKFHIQNSAPVRTGNLTVRIEANEAVAMKLNYMAFRNMPYDSTWHFAFINNVTWLSADSVSIDFELDIFSECFYTTNFKPCFVERMHIPKSQDIAGANVVPDDIETGVMECYNHSWMDWGKNYLTMFISQYPSGTPEYATHFANNIYSGLYVQSYPCDTAEEASSIDTILETFTGKEDAINLMTMSPYICEPDDDSSKGDGLRHMNWESSIDYQFGYTPKNQKLFTYPYVYMMTDDNSGNQQVYKPELFSGDKWEFESVGCKANMPQVLTFPTNYGGFSYGLYTYGFVTSNFPICAWSYDTFKAYVAQNKNSLALSMNQAEWNQGTGFIAGALAGAKSGGGSAFPVTGAIGGVAGGIVGGSSGYFQIQNIMASIQDKEFIPRTSRGKINSENLKFALGLNRVDFYAMRPKLSMCKVIDDYWTAFGYPIHEITTPQINSRSSWNYVKTVDCAFTAEAEMNILSRYRDIFNKGVTIWHTNDIGNYNLSNV